MGGDKYMMLQEEIDTLRRDLNRLRAHVELLERSMHRTSVVGTQFGPAAVPTTSPKFVYTVEGRHE